MVHAHELKRLTADDAGTVQLTSVGQCLGKAVVVVDGRDQAAAAGEKAVGFGEAGVLWVVLQAEAAAGLELIAGSEARDAVGRDGEEGVGHLQRVEDMALEVVVQAHARQYLHQITADVCRHRVIPRGTW